MSETYRFEAALKSIECEDMEGLSDYLTTEVNLNQKDDRGWTLLTAAIVCNNTNAIYALLEKGASALIKDNLGMTPVDHAIELRHFELVKKLRRPSKAA
ncbi:MAG: ankyrin repeat domain-containing protein [Asticcacaulis sp.]|uniref:ankyrin repeat domain-containing protein n=1 Tax=Asticcacaulis sp. TaxID=1872648 RepID=UPI0025C296C4|nr:ankyrin repeat domain-containing protein [Asticcacaulis sp.]MCA1935765.1 ankyrin repeat domain-containing protein [Asticcacaulis sp.]